MLRIADRFTVQCWLCWLMYRESREAIRTLLIHLQRLVKSMNSKQVLEGKEIAKISSYQDTLDHIIIIVSNIL